MKKGMKIGLIVGLIALVLTIGVIGSVEIRPFGDPPFGLINLIK